MSRGGRVKRAGASIWRTARERKHARLQIDVLAWAICNHPAGGGEDVAAVGFTGPVAEIHAQYREIPIGGQKLAHKTVIGTGGSR